MKLSRPDKIGIAGIGLLMINVALQTVIFPSILKSAVNKRVVLKSDSRMRRMWSKSPFPLEHHWYLFNVTNPDEINKGGKPIIREVGPFVYDVWQERINQEDHEEDDTVSYALRNTYYFNAEKSNGLDDDDELTMPHLLLLGIPNGLMRDRPFLMPIASRAIDSVMHNPPSMFVRAKAATMLYDGFLIDCRGIEDFHGKVLCNEMAANYDNFFLVKIGDKRYSNSLWGPFNTTEKMAKHVRIRRGTSDIKDVGRLVEFMHKKNFSAWKSDRCDAFHGTDYSIFPPFLDQKKRESFHATFGLLCRSFHFSYDSRVEYEGLQLLRYTALVGADGRNKPEERCYCLDPAQCPPRGVFDLYKCLQVPLTISSPHFYQADVDLVRDLDGLRPDKERHMMIIDIDPLTGYAVRVNVRLQVSLNIKPLKKYRLMESFPDVLLPVAWFDMQTTLPPSVIREIKACHRIATMAKLVNYLLSGAGLAMCARAAYHRYKLRREKQLNAIEQLPAATSAGQSAASANGAPSKSAAMPASID